MGRKERKYLIVCNEHNKSHDDFMTFWGHRTEDNEKRSFDGYTYNLLECELYSLEDLEDLKIPIADNTISKEDFYKLNDLIISKDDLFNLKW